MSLTFFWRGGRSVLGIMKKRLFHWGNTAESGCPVASIQGQATAAAVFCLAWNLGFINFLVPRFTKWRWGFQAGRGWILHSPSAWQMEELLNSCWALYSVVFSGKPSPIPLCLSVPLQKLYQRNGLLVQRQSPRHTGWQKHSEIIFFAFSTGMPALHELESQGWPVKLSDVAYGVNMQVFLDGSSERCTFPSVEKISHQYPGAYSR